MKTLEKLLGLVIAPIEWFSPRMKAAGLIGLYARSQSKVEGIAYLEEVIALSCRPRRQLKDELLLFTAFSELFKAYAELGDHDAAIRHGIRAVTLLLEGREFGWKFFEESGNSQRSLVTNLMNLIHRRRPRSTEITPAADLAKLEQLMREMNDYFQQGQTS